MNPVLADCPTVYTLNTLKPHKCLYPRGLSPHLVFLFFTAADVYSLFWASLNSHFFTLTLTQHNHVIITQNLLEGPLRPQDPRQLLASFIRESQDWLLARPTLYQTCFNILLTNKKVNRKNSSFLFVIWKIS